MECGNVRKARAQSVDFQRAKMQQALYSTLELSIFMDSQNAQKTNVQLKVSTHEALKNLFGILQITGNNFDECMFELATRAFSAYSDVHPDTQVGAGKLRKTLIKHDRQRKPRRQIEIKATTFAELQDLHSKLFPFLPWQSWTWLLEEMYDICRDKRLVLREELATYEPVDENI